MDKNTKKDIKKLTVDDKITIKELEDKLTSMKVDKEKKCKSAKEQLVDMLEITVDKYRTATGTAEAMRVLRFVCGEDDFVDVSIANELAWELAVETDKMKKKALTLTYAEMDKLCDGFYEKEFKGTSAYELAFEMMRIDLCRQVGSAAEDMVEFIKRTQEEIDSTGEKLKELKKSNPKKED